LIPLRDLLDKPLPGTSRTVLRNWLGKLQALCLYVAPAFTEQERQWFYDQFVINWTKTTWVLWYQDLTNLPLKMAPPPRGPTDADGDRVLWKMWAISRQQLDTNWLTVEHAVKERTRQRLQEAAVAKRAAEYEAVRLQMAREAEEARKAYEARQAYEAAKLQQQQELQRKAEVRGLRLVGPNEPPPDLTPPVE
jgi:capsular polysaccharide biosynthesis protein